MKADNILGKVGGKTGYTVPQGYFDNVRAQILESLPEYQAAEQPKPTVWERVRPYLYMAAMFAGIWCMMKMFHMMTTSDLSLDNPPEAVVMAMADADHSDWTYISNENTESFILEEELSESYDSIDEFKSDFNNSDI